MTSRREITPEILEALGSPVSGVVHIRYNPDEITHKEIQDTMVTVLPAFGIGAMVEEAQDISKDFRISVLSSSGSDDIALEGGEVVAVVSWRLQLPWIVATIAESSLLVHTASPKTLAELMGPHISPISATMLFVRDDVCEALHDTVGVSAGSIEGICTAKGLTRMVEMDSLFDAIESMENDSEESKEEEG